MAQRSSSSELSDALSDIPEDALPLTNVVLEETLIGETVVTEPVAVKRGKKRSVQTGADSGKKAKTEADDHALVKGSDSAKTDEKLSEAPNPTPTNRRKRRKPETNGELPIHVDVKAEAQSIKPAADGSSPKGRRRAKIKEKVNEEAQEAQQIPTAQTTPAKKPKRKRKVKAKENEEGTQQGEDGTVVKKVRRRRKTKEEKEAEAMPLVERTVDCRFFLGAHVSAAGGVHNAVTNSVHIGGNAFALFLKSQRKWDNPALKDDHLTQFHAHCTAHAYDAAQHVLPHGSYLVNLAHPDPARHAQAYAAFLDDLERCEKLRIGLYNFHPGSTNKCPRPDAIGRVAAALNRAHAATKSVVTLLETMAARDSNTLGASFEDLRDIIALVEDKARVGVCFDTCHVFAAGYDLRAPDEFKATMQRFDSVVGMKYLRALHLNDSKAPLASGRDLHANIGTGFLGLRAFHNVMNEARFWGLPMVLETPIDVKDAEGKEVQDKRIWADEIKLLESFVRMDVEDEAFRTRERELAAKGEAERRRIEEQVERRKEKLAKKNEGKGRRRKKGQAAAEVDGDEGSESKLNSLDGGDSELSSLESSGEDER